MKRKRFIYGWRAGSVDEYQLYVYQNKKGWGVTRDPKDAKVFKSIKDCQEHYLSKLSFPEKYVKYLTNGYVTYFESRSLQMVII